MGPVNATVQSLFTMKTSAAAWLRLVCHALIQVKMCKECILPENHLALLIPGIQSKCAHVIRTTLKQLMVHASSWACTVMSAVLIMSVTANFI